ncbi:hypothetical protein [Henriciella sp.]|uniref:hypothetical protein n=1 Tax=Henriciella sp. TaxID=1968823 RepID=UPI0025C28D67|nr:hypothetical protein [Henriciella sp.]
MTDDRENPHDGCAECMVWNMADIRRIVRQRLEVARENFKAETKRFQRQNEKVLKRR